MIQEQYISVICFSNTMARLVTATILQQNPFICTLASPLKPKLVHVLLLLFALSQFWDCQQKSAMYHLVLCCNVNVTKVPVFDAVL